MSSEASEYDKDSDIEYELDTDSLEELAKSNNLSRSALQSTFIKQRGVCRITRMPFGEGSIYGIAITPRNFNEDMSDANHVFVLQSIASMRNAVGLNWRSFSRFMQQIGKEAEL